MPSRRRASQSRPQKESGSVAMQNRNGLFCLIFLILVRTLWFPYALALFPICAHALFQGRYLAVIKYLPSRTLIEARSRPVVVYKKLTGMLVDIGIQAIAISGELFHVFDMLITGTTITISINFRGFLKLHANKFVTNLVIGHTWVVIKIKIMLQFGSLKYGESRVLYGDDLVNFQSKFKLSMRICR